MDKKNEVEKLLDSLAYLELLEEVPADVSKRFHQTLSGLSNQSININPKKNGLNGSRQFAMAASFILVFALGAVVTLNSGGTKDGQLNLTKPASPIESSNSIDKDDQLLYSSDDKSQPKQSESFIKETNSGHDYSDIPMDFPKRLGATFSWNSELNLDAKTTSCLKGLELSRNTNLIDNGFLGTKNIKAIWSPLTNSSWNVILIDANCVALEKKYVEQ